MFCIIFATCLYLKNPSKIVSLLNNNYISKDEVKCTLHFSTR